jgi:hypothetical protein
VEGHNLADTTWSIIETIATFIIAAAGGLLGMIVGVNIHEVKIKNIEERLSEFRTEANASFQNINQRLDRFIDRRD